jgi:hypothetical protein
MKRAYLVQRGTRAVGRTWCRFGYPRKPFEPAEVITLLKTPRLAHSARLSKYRNDNLCPIYRFINGLDMADLSLILLLRQKKSRSCGSGVTTLYLVKNRVVTSSPDVGGRESPRGWVLFRPLRQAKLSPLNSCPSFCYAASACYTLTRAPFL